MKNKGTACSCKCCGNYIPAVTTCELVVLPSWHCFRNPDALDPPLCLVRIVRQCLRKTLEKLLQDTAGKYGCEYCLTNIARACNFFYDRCVKCALSYTSRAEEVMRECDIHHTRSIKTISSVNLSRKPGLDLCCDLLQSLQGVLWWYGLGRPVITSEIGIWSVFV